MNATIRIGPAHCGQTSGSTSKIFCTSAAHRRGASVGASRDRNGHVRAYQISGGAGTYTTRGTTYREHLDIFVIPSWIGTSFRATCRIEGELWYHSFTEPNDTTAGPGPYQHFIEVWRRLE